MSARKGEMRRHRGELEGVDWPAAWQAPLLQYGSAGDPSWRRRWCCLLVLMLVLVLLLVETGPLRCHVRIDYPPMRQNEPKIWTG